MRALVFLCALVALAWPAAAVATRTVVPDDHATIAAAVASGADSIYVRDGEYPEAVVLDHPIVLDVVPSNIGDLGMPRVASLANASAGPNGPVVRGFHVRGAVALGSGGFVLENCRVDGPVAGGGVNGDIKLRGCILLGGVSMYPFDYEVLGCTIVGGLEANYIGRGVVRSSYVTGPAAAGLYVTAKVAGGDFSFNTIRDVGEGIVLRQPEGGARVEGNDIGPCEGTGLRAFKAFPDEGGSFRAVRNTLHDLGGDGIRTDDPFGFVTLDSNLVEDTGDAGMRVSATLLSATGNVIERAGKAGVWLESGTAGVFRGNRVVASGGAGVVLASAGRVEGNVVGHSADRGLVVLSSAGLVARANTVYLSGGNGMKLTGASGDSVDHNVSHANVGHGLFWSGGGAPVLGCNDWSANLDGPTSGIEPAPSDLQLDPRFCDVPADDVRLAADSPLLAAGACGLIGALGAGCAAPVAVEGVAAGEPQGLRALPRPARGGVRFAFPRAEETRRLAVYDVAGALRWGAEVGRGADALEWKGTDSTGRRLPAGVYFAKLSGARGDVGTRVVLMR